MELVVDHGGAGDGRPDDGPPIVPERGEQLPELVSRQEPDRHAHGSSTRLIEIEELDARRRQPASDDDQKTLVDDRSELRLGGHRHPETDAVEEDHPRRADRHAGRGGDRRGKDGRPAEDVARLDREHGPLLVAGKTETDGDPTGDNHAKGLTPGALPDEDRRGGSLGEAADGGHLRPGGYREPRPRRGVAEERRERRRLHGSIVPGRRLRWAGPEVPQRGDRPALFRRTVRAG